MMECVRCGEFKPFTYRSKGLGKRSVCAACIEVHWPETLGPCTSPACGSWSLETVVPPAPKVSFEVPSGLEDVHG